MQRYTAVYNNDCVLSWFLYNILLQTIDIMHTITHRVYTAYQNYDQQSIYTVHIHQNDVSLSNVTQLFVLSNCVAAHIQLDKVARRCRNPHSCILTQSPLLVRSSQWTDRYPSLVVLRMPYMHSAKAKQNKCWIYKIIHLFIHILYSMYIIHIQVTKSHRDVLSIQSVGFIRYSRDLYYLKAAGAKYSLYV